MKNTPLPSENGKDKAAAQGKSTPKPRSRSKAKNAPPPQDEQENARASQEVPAAQTVGAPPLKSVAKHPAKSESKAAPKSPSKSASSKASPPSALKTELEPLQYLFNSDMPLADWNIGGIFQWDKLCIGILGTVMLLKTPESKLPEFSGCPPCLWALNWFRSESLMVLNKIKSSMESFVKEKVGVFLYFDNPFLTPVDMNDSLCNGLIKLLAEYNPHRLNGVYVASSLLAKHVRANFPGLRIRLAANFHIKEKIRTAQWYNNLAMRYDRVALDPRDGINVELLSRLRDKKKFEITVNDTWVNTADGGRRKHMELLGKILREPMNIDYRVERQKYLQESGTLSPKVPSDSRPLTLTTSEVQALYQQGFRHFRLQAESLSNEMTLAHFFGKFLMTSDPALDYKKAVMLTTLLIQRDPAGVQLPTGMKNYIIRQYE